MKYSIALLPLACVLLMTSQEVKTSGPSGFQILSGLCMSKRSDRLVYRHKNTTHVYIAFDILKKGKVEVYSWEIIRASTNTFISKMTETVMPAVDFRKSVDRDHIIGACSKRNYVKFKTRLQRKMKNCKRLERGVDKSGKRRVKKKHCKMTAIMEVFIRMKMRNVEFNDDFRCDL